MPAKIILAFTGRIGSGKGTACKYFIERYGAVEVRFSHPLRDILDRVYLEKNRENLQDVSTVLRQRFGNDLLARTIAKDVEKLDASLIVVDGVRRVEDVQFLRAMPGFRLIAISADERIRFERIRGRGENTDDATKTWEEFQKQESAETEVTIPEVMKSASATVENGGTVESFFASLETMYQSIAHET